MASEYIKSVADDGTVTETYSRDGKLHRDEGRAVIERRAAISQCVHSVTLN